MGRDWIEFPNPGEPTLALAREHISAVQSEGDGCIIVCGPTTYHLHAISYERGCALAGFVPTIVDARAIDAEILKKK